MLCPTCTKVNDASALACTFCGMSFGAARGSARHAAAPDRSERGRGAPGAGAAEASAPPPALGHKVPTLKGVSAPAPALEARPSARTRTMIGVATPGPGNQRPAAPAPAAPAEAPTARSFDQPVPSPREALRELLRRHGEEVMTDPRRCSSLLAADYHRQVSYLVAALEERIPQRMVVEASAAPIEIVVLAMADELGKRRELPGASALHAVESWAIALGLLAPPPGEGTGV
ncbi:MAG TPA: hypothetical protein VFS43_40555 [Polyangiaceae bacterium]|nr:hypothetical protein [Polyangiaceae bacterium]